MIFYITGPDSYRAFKKLQELKAKFIKEVDPTGLNLTTIDGTQLSAQDLPHLFSTVSLLAKRRCLIIKQALASKDKDLAAALAKMLNRDRGAADHIVIFYEPDEPAEKNPLHLWLKERAHHQKFPKLLGPALKKFVTERAAELGHVITASAVESLLERGQQDLWWVMQDLDKCHAYLAPGAPIEDKTLDALTVPSPVEEVFPMVDAMLRGDLSAAGPRLMDYLDNESSPQLLIGLMESQLRTLYLLSSDPSLSRRSIPGTHPFVVRKIAPWAARRRPEDVKKIYLALCEVDQDLKSTSLDPKILLLRFLATACQV